MNTTPTVQDIERAAWPWHHAMPTMGRLNLTLTMSRSARIEATRRMARRDGWDDERLRRALEEVEAA